MEISLSNTWIAIRIGNSEYCINSEYVTGITELDKAEYKRPVYSSGIIKGVYIVYGANLHVLDGRRLLGYTTTDEEKLNFSASIHNLKYRHLDWLDDLEWSIMTHDTFNKTLNVDESELAMWIKTIDYNDEKLNSIVRKLYEPLEVIHRLADKALSENNGTIYSQAHNLIYEIKRQSEKYIIKGLDNLIEIHNKGLTETCVAIRCKGLDFGISADSIVSISEQSGEISKVCNDRLSAGTVRIKGKEYNIINLTKLTSIVKDYQEG